MLLPQEASGIFREIQARRKRRASRREREGERERGKSNKSAKEEQVETWWMKNRALEGPKYVSRW